MIAHVGNYCGRTALGWWGEPQNSLTNLGFVIAAAVAFVRWRRAPLDGPKLYLIVNAALIGVGSYIFHSDPLPRTLPIDLIPIQVFVLAFASFAARRFLAWGWPATLALVPALLVGGIAWGRLVQGVLGGGAGHLLGLAGIVWCGSWLAMRTDPDRRRAGKILLAAAATYSIAIGVRALDQPLCAAFPFGLHWLWHSIQGVTVGLLLDAAIRFPDRETPPGSDRLSRRAS